MMGRLDYHKEYKAACAAGPNVSGNYQPTTNWEIGIPVDSLKQIDRSQFVQNGVGAGAVITVWGSMVTKFDNPTPSFDMSVPITNGNPFTAISGTVRKQKDPSQQLTYSAAVFGGTTTKVHMGGSGITNTANEVWDFKFTYTLT